MRSDNVSMGFFNPMERCPAYPGHARQSFFWHSVCLLPSVLDAYGAHSFEKFCLTFCMIILILCLMWSWLYLDLYWRMKK